MSERVENEKQELYPFHDIGENFVSSGRQLAYLAQQRAHQSAVIEVSRSGTSSIITYEELHKISNQLAWWMRQRGLTSDDIILISYPNSIEHFIAVFAIWKIGACYLPVSEKCTADDLDHLCDKVRIDGCFGEQGVDGSRFLLKQQELIDICKNCPDETPQDVAANPNMISVTSGTTGQMKLIRQDMPAGMTRDLLHYWMRISGMDFGQRQLLLGPLWHGAPHSAAFDGLYMGHTLIVPHNLSPESIVHLIREYQIEYLQMVPTLMYRIMQLPKLAREDFKSVQAFCHTGGYCPPEQKQKWIDLLGAENVYEIYGMTEVIGVIGIRGDEWVRHRGSVGHVCQMGEISIRGPGNKSLQPYEVGEIYMKIPEEGFRTEYVGLAPLPVQHGGYRSVGDMGYLDEDGYLYFVDRRSDMFVVGGENVFAAEVEAVLLRYPSVTEAAVVGIPDEEWGHRLHMLLVSQEEIFPEKLRAFLQLHLLPYKIPHTFQRVSALPHGKSGKLDRVQILKDSLAVIDRGEIDRL